MLHPSPPRHPRLHRQDEVLGNPGPWHHPALGHHSSRYISTSHLHTLHWRSCHKVATCFIAYGNCHFHTIFWGISTDWLRGRHTLANFNCVGRTARGSISAPSPPAVCTGLISCTGSCFLPLSLIIIIIISPSTAICVCCLFCRVHRGVASHHLTSAGTRHTCSM